VGPGLDIGDPFDVAVAADIPDVPLVERDIDLLRALERGADGVCRGNDRLDESL
jgi:hypothetical protein